MDLSILGKEISEVKENDFFKIFSKGLKEYKAFENDIDCHYYSEEKGIDFIFENNILVSIHFSGRNDNKYKLLKGELPFNINILDDKIDVYKKFGDLEVKKGGGEILPFIGKANKWATFKIEHYYFRFEFNDDNSITLISVTKKLM